MLARWSSKISSTFVAFVHNHQPLTDLKGRILSAPTCSTTSTLLLSPLSPPNAGMVATCDWETFMGRGELIAGHQLNQFHPCRQTVDERPSLCVCRYPTRTYNPTPTRYGLSFHRWGYVVPPSHFLARSLGLASIRLKGKRSRSPT